MGDNDDINLELGKGKRFSIVPKYLEFQYDIILLNDFDFWNTHYEELKNWCDLHLLQIDGMTIEFKRTEDLTLFILRWS